MFVRIRALCATALTKFNSFTLIPNDDMRRKSYVEAESYCFTSIFCYMVIMLNNPSALWGFFAKAIYITRSSERGRQNHNYCRASHVHVETRETIMTAGVISFVFKLVSKLIIWSCSSGLFMACYCIWDILDRARRRNEKFRNVRNACSLRSGWCDSCVMRWIRMDFIVSFSTWTSYWKLGARWKDAQVDVVGVTESKWILRIVAVMSLKEHNSGNLLLQ